MSQIRKTEMATISTEQAKARPHNVFIVSTNYKAPYKLYRDPEEFYDTHMESNEDKHFYEILDHTKPNRFYIDVDAKPSDFDMCFEDLHEDLLIHSIDMVIELFDSIDLEIERKDICVTDSSHKDHKVSFHLVVLPFVFDRESTISLFQHALDCGFIDEKYRETKSSVFDPNVYKKGNNIQNFRLLGSWKNEEPKREKVFLCPEDNSEQKLTKELFLSSLISWYDPAEVREICDQDSESKFEVSLSIENISDSQHDLSAITELSEDDKPLVIEMINESCPRYKLNGKWYNHFLLKRGQGAICPIHQRVHESAGNNCFLFIRQGKVFIKCMRDTNNHKAICIGNLKIDHPFKLNGSSWYELNDKLAGTFEVQSRDEAIQVYTDLLLPYMRYNIISDQALLLYEDQIKVLKFKNVENSLVFRYKIAEDDQETAELKTQIDELTCEFNDLDVAELEELAECKSEFEEKIILIEESEPELKELEELPKLEKTTSSLTVDEVNEIKEENKQIKEEIKKIKALNKDIEKENRKIKASFVTRNKKEIVELKSQRRVKLAKIKVQFKSKKDQALANLKSLKRELAGYEKSSEAKYYELRAKDIKDRREIAYTHTETCREDDPDPKIINLRVPFNGKVKESYDQSKIQPFLDFLEDMCGSKEHLDWFLQVLAQAYFGSKRPIGVLPIFYSKYGSIGKSFLINRITDIFNPKNVGTVANFQAFENYNDPLSRHCVMIYSELTSYHSLSDNLISKLKTSITDPRIPIKEKFLGDYTIRNGSFQVACANMNDVVPATKAPPPPPPPPVAENFASTSVPTSAASPTLRRFPVLCSRIPKDTSSEKFDKLEETFNAGLDDFVTYLKTLWYPAKRMGEHFPDNEVRKEQKSFRTVIERFMRAVVNGHTPVGDSVNLGTVRKRIDKKFVEQEVLLFNDPLATFKKWVEVEGEDKFSGWPLEKIKSSLKDSFDARLDVRYKNLDKKRQIEIEPSRVKYLLDSERYEDEAETEKAKEPKIDLNRDPMKPEFTKV